ncbi:MAG: DUF998 domain-containing protein [Thermoplasmatota archaeon]
MVNWAGPAAGIASVITVFLVGWLSPGHDMIHGYISTLSQTDAPLRAWYVAGGTVAAGLGILFFAGRWRKGDSALHAVGLTCMIAFYVLHWMGAALVPCDAGCAWLTPTGRLHYAIGFAAFVNVGLGTILLSIHAKNRGLHIATGVFVAGAVALLITDRIGAWHGLAERFEVVALAAWMWWLATLPPSGTLHPGWPARQPARMHQSG